MKGWNRLPELGNKEGHVSTWPCLILALFIPGRCMTDQKCLMPGKLRPGDLIRFVSPASPVDEPAVRGRAKLLENLGFRVDFGRHAFARHDWYAGTDAQRLEDLNNALGDPEVRAIFATRGGKGSYRIADRLDFAAVRRDPKPIVGFSDITALHLSLYRNTGLVGIHGALYGEKELDEENRDILLQILTQTGTSTYYTRESEPSSAISTQGQATGPLVGGNLDMIATCAGWALPDLRGCILLIEAVDCQPGRLDRMLTLLCNAGHLAGIAGVAVGQFTMERPFDEQSRIIAMIGDHLKQFAVPVLGGLPFGHGKAALSVPVGAMAHLDTSAGTLTVSH
jgi:muramoyltetrapeptide carboxypeptidase